MFHTSPNRCENKRDAAQVGVSFSIAGVRGLSGESKTKGETDKELKSWAILRCKGWKRDSLGKPVQGQNGTHNSEQLCEFSGMLFGPWVRAPMDLSHIAYSRAFLCVRAPLWASGMRLAVMLSVVFLLAGQSFGEESGQLVQKGQPTTIPGCGISGCYQQHEICVNVPAGATAVSIVNYYDSFSGWGGFSNERKTPTGFCATYTQHSHNVTRVVSFDVVYQPAPAVPIPAAEATLLDKVRKGEMLVFTGPPGAATRSVHGSFLQTLLMENKNNDALKARGLEIDGAEFSTEVNVTRVAVPFAVHLVNCRFLDGVSVQDVRFDSSVVIEDSVFQKSMQVQKTWIKEDLILKVSVPDSGNPPVLLVHDSHVDGRTEISTGTASDLDNLKTGDLHVVVARNIGLLNLSELDVNSLRVDGAANDIQVQSLYVSGSRSRNGVRIGPFQIGSFKADRAEIGDLILSDTKVLNGLDMSFSNLNSFVWAMGQSGKFPKQENTDLTGLTFKNIRVTRAGKASDSENGGTASPSSKTSADAEIAKTSLEMLNSSKYSASAYDALDKLLASRGESQADDVFVAGREARRRSEISSNFVVGAFMYVSDLFQEYVLGYGRIARWPIFWSVIIICVGFFVFGDKARMEKSKPSTGDYYSKFWYSLELFLPIIDMGIASEWQPKSEHRVTATYARIHKVAGWILVPVTLAAFAGLTK
jgi:hypothetical protein